MSDPDLCFINVTGTEKPDSELRRSIRSHVMVGKNRGKKFPGRKKKTKDRDAILSSGDLSKESSQTVVPGTIPRKIGSELSTLHFPNGVKPEVVEVVFRFSYVSKELIFPLKRCIFFEKRTQDWLEPLTLDTAYLHAMIFTSRHHFEAIGCCEQQHKAPGALHHLLETLRLLRGRLAGNDDAMQLSDTTAAAITALAGHALLTGDIVTARSHMEGLRKIIYLKGGFGSMRANMKLLVEIIRCDIGIVMQNGSRRTFHQSITASEHFTPYPDPEALPALQTPGRLVAETDPDVSAIGPPDDWPEDLRYVWKALYDFCRMVNFALVFGGRYPVDVFLDTMTAVMYRLLAMDYERDSACEAIRLGLLAYSCSIFLQWQYLGATYPVFNAEFRDSLMNMEALGLDPRFALWLLAVGSSTAFDESDNDWLKPMLLYDLGAFTTI
ncbi:hypothetical protein BJ166DRAFT_594346 [Pestalotiopsis sp. NC0098]|nr:hypothetical protein BJ166DRAFT_594346 [Pestalotiopsis sp. NC0098]